MLIKPDEIIFLMLVLYRIRDRELSHLSVAGGPSVSDRLLATSGGGHVGENHELHGREGKYRRTSSPASISSPLGVTNTPTPPPKAAAPLPSTVSDKSPAKTPSRQSPATIAAKGKQEAHRVECTRVNHLLQMVSMCC